MNSASFTIRVDTCRRGFAVLIETSSYLDVDTGNTGRGATSTKSSVTASNCDTGLGTSALSHARSAGLKWHVEALGGLVPGYKKLIGNDLLRQGGVQEWHELDPVRVVLLPGITFSR